MVEEVIPNARERLLVMSARFPQATFIMETGTHSPRVSQFLLAERHRVVVANARKLRAICSSVRPPGWAPDRLALRCAPGYAISTLPRSVRQPHQERRGDHDSHRPEPVEQARSGRRERRLFSLYWGRSPRTEDRCRSPEATKPGERPGMLAKRRPGSAHRTIAPRQLGLPSGGERFPEIWRVAQTGLCG